MSLGMPQDMTLANRRRTARRLLSQRRKMSYIEQRSMPYVTTLANRRRYKIPYIANINKGKPQDTTLANRRRASVHLSPRRRQWIRFLASMKPEKRKDKTLANRRRTSQSISSRSWLDSILSLYEPREAIRHDARKPTPSVATPTQDSTLIVHESTSPGKARDTTLANWDRRVATPIPKCILSQQKPQEDTRQDSGKPIPSVATPTKDATCVDKHRENRRRA
jgi:hypothetical protein